MTDLSRVLPHFPVGQFARLIPALEKHGLSTSDLLTLDAADIGKRTHLPLLDLKRLCSAVLDSLHADLGVSAASGVSKAQAGQQFQSRSEDAPGKSDAQQTSSVSALRNTAASLAAQWQTISTLDPALDRALGGGIPAGYVTEITGESGAGKTQFLLTLLLSVQLPPPHGLGRPALYISTEAPLPTRRLSQLLSAHPLFQRLPASQRPSLDNIISTATPDLESQDHILSFQVPVEVERRGIGLLVLDSVAANYRAEFERSGSTGQQGSNMAARTAELVRLGMHLRDLAQRHNLAVVVSNQVADRFSPVGGPPQRPASSLHQPHRRHYGLSHSNSASKVHVRPTQETLLATRSRPPPPGAPEDHPPPSSSSLPPSGIGTGHTDPPPPPPPPQIPPDEDPHYQQDSHLALLLDHQQRWFTGWGDDLYADGAALKTPSLGLVWSTQISARIALLRRPDYGYGQRRRQRRRRGEDGDDDVDGEEGTSTPASMTRAGVRGWRRWMKVVFAPHVGESGPGLDGAVEFEVWMGGLRAVVGDGSSVEDGKEGEG
ncbi:hypothetical protein VTK56DRAFT_8751 [Thermocarpiscus australiensis]